MNAVERIKYLKERREEANLDIYIPLIANSRLDGWKEALEEVDKVLNKYIECSRLVGGEHPQDIGYIKALYCIKGIIMNWQEELK